MPESAGYADVRYDDIFREKSLSIKNPDELVESE